MNTVLLELYLEGKKKRQGFAGKGMTPNNGTLPSLNSMGLKNLALHSGTRKGDSLWLHFWSVTIAISLAFPGSVPCKFIFSGEASPVHPSTGRTSPRFRAALGQCSPRGAGPCSGLGEQHWLTDSLPPLCEGSKQL